MTQRIAMWSGPRNISTALMRSWENRSDCSVVDEPFYAAYLADTGLDHPCREQILLTQSTDYGKVIEELTRNPVGTPMQYQKQMTHHIPRGMSMEWCATFKHCFLIRDPAQVIASYLQKMPSIDEDAIGISRQAELYDQISGISGSAPAVIDSNDVLQNPQQLLKNLCLALDVDFPEEQMLTWPTGRRSSDGIWADHWYHNVEQSTGFGEYQTSQSQLSEEHLALARGNASALSETGRAADQGLNSQTTAQQHKCRAGPGASLTLLKIDCSPDPGHLHTQSVSRT